MSTHTKIPNLYRTVPILEILNSRTFQQQISSTTFQSRRGQIQPSINSFSAFYSPRCGFGFVPQFPRKFSSVRRQILIIDSGKNIPPDPAEPGPSLLLTVHVPLITLSVPFHSVILPSVEIGTFLTPSPKQSISI